MGEYDEKEVIYLDHVESEFVDRMIVVLKKNSKLKKKNRKDLVREAERIIQEYINQHYYNSSPQYAPTTQTQHSVPLTSKSKKKKWDRVDLFLNGALFITSMVFLYYLVKLFN